MKNLNIMFTDKEYAALKRAKHKFDNGISLSWRQFLLKLASQINKKL